MIPSKCSPLTSWIRWYTNETGIVMWVVERSLVRMVRNHSEETANTVACTQHRCLECWSTHRMSHWTGYPCGAVRWMRVSSLPCLWQWKYNLSLLSTPCSSTTGTITITSHIMWFITSHTITIQTVQGNHRRGAGRKRGRGSGASIHATITQVCQGMGWVGAEWGRTRGESGEGEEEREGERKGRGRGRGREREGEQEGEDSRYTSSRPCEWMPANVIWNLATTVLCACTLLGRDVRG